MKFRHFLDNHKNDSNTKDYGTSNIEFELKAPLKLILKVILQQKQVFSLKHLEFYQNYMTNLSNKGLNFSVKIKQRH